MLTIETTRIYDKEKRSEKTVLVINDNVIENSYVIEDFSVATVYDTNESTKLVSLPMSSLLEKFKHFSLKYQHDWCKDILEFDGMSNRLSFTYKPGHSSAELNVRVLFDFETWAHPWSINHFIEALKLVVEQLALNHLTVFNKETEEPLKDFGLCLNIPNPNMTIKDIMTQWEPDLHNVIATTIQTLINQHTPNTLSTIFRFPEAISSACSQYLIYFGQFLADIGIQASIELSEKTDYTLFRVTPKDANEALTNIQSALNAYLNMPGNTAFMSELQQENDVAVLQLRANITHLESQLILAQAILQANEATIDALKLSNFQLQQLNSTANTTISPSPTQISPSKKDTETILFGTISVQDWESKIGFNIHLPEIIRKIKRRFRSET